MKHRFITIALILIAVTLHADDRPNILGVFAEDTSPWMGCYGHEANKLATPNIDSIAAAGVRFDRAFVPAPVWRETGKALREEGGSVSVVTP